MAVQTTILGNNENYIVTFSTFFFPFLFFLLRTVDDERSIVQNINGRLLLFFFNVSTTILNKQISTKINVESCKKSYERYYSKRGKDTNR